MLSSIEVPLGFFSADKVSPDTERPGLLRAARISDPDNPQELSFHNCPLHDWSCPGSAPLDLNRMGFDTLDLSGLPGVQEVLGRVRDAGEINTENARSLRRGLRGKSFRLSSGRRLKLLFIAPEGLIMRKAGPNGLQPDPDVAMSEMNGHGAALAIHGDQDVRGTPLKQMMHGLAPWMFRHQTPDGNNGWSPLMLVNLWIPLDQITRPLTLMDRSTLDKRRQQLRYALPTDAFLDRNADMTVNDIWTFLHDKKQRWYFSSRMDARQAYVFDTLGTPHGSAMLPGEEKVEEAYLALQAACAALDARDGASAISALPALQPGALEGSTEALSKTYATMLGLMQELRDGGVSTEHETGAWLAGAHAVMNSVIRKSIEMRVVALQTPGILPLR